MDPAPVAIADAIAIERDAVIKSALGIAALLQAVIQMSDDVTQGRGALDTQGRLLRLQSSIQKNRTRMFKTIDDFSGLLNEYNARKGK